MITPTLAELYSSIQTDLRNKLGILSIIGKTKLNAYAIVQAAKLKLFYLRSQQTYKNIYLDQCDDETIVRFGRIILKRDPFAATAGEYKIEVTGDVAATIPAGTTFKSRDTSLNPNQIFILDTLFTFTATTGLIDIRALEPGEVSLLEVTNEVKLTQPIANVEGVATVTSVVTAPIEAETTENYRQKVITAAQIEPQGGARVDFLLWSLDAQGCRTTYPYVKSTAPSEINLYVEANPADSVGGNGVPTATILTAVETVIDLDPDTTKPIADRGRRPMWAVLSVADGNIKSVVTIPVDIEITTLSDVTLLTAIEAALVAFVFNIRPYLDGATPPTDSQMGKLYAADISTVIRDTIGTATFADVEVQVDSSVVTSFYEFLDGKIPYINSVTNV